MGSFTTSKVLLKGVADDKGLAPAVVRGESGDGVVHGLRKLEREHHSTGVGGIHTRIMGTDSIAVNTHHPGKLVPSRAVEDPSKAPLATLIRTRREGMSPKMSQAELGRLVGLNQRSISNLETGVVKTVSADVANLLVTVLPITMAELARAGGMEMPRAHTTVDEDIIEMLETADPQTIASVRLVLLGARALKQAAQRKAG